MAFEKGHSNRGRRRNPNVKKGWVNFADGCRKRFEEIQALSVPKKKNDALRQALERVVKILLEEYQLEDVSDLDRLDVTDADTRLRNRLTLDGYDAGYVRTCLTHFHKPINALQSLDDYESQVRHVRTLLEPHGEFLRLKDPTSCIREHFFAFLRRDKVDFEVRPSDSLIRDFRLYLRDRVGLKVGGAVDRYPRVMKHILARCGFEFTPAPSKKAFHDSVEAAIRQIQEAALKRHTQKQSVMGKPKLFEAAEQSNRRTRPVTWDRTERSLRVFLSFLRKQDPTGFESRSLRQLLSIENFKQFLSEAHETDRYTTATADTFIDSLTRVFAFGASSKAKGFEEVTEEESRTFQNMLWKYIYDVTPKLQKPGRNARIIENGGVPKYQIIYPQLLDTIEHELENLILIFDPSRRVGKNRWHERDRLGLEKNLRYAANKVADLVAGTMMSTFAARPTDFYERITLAKLHRISYEDFKSKEKSDWFYFFYLPSKTNDNPNPSEVDACIAPWFTPILDLYLGELHGVRYPGATLLYPADIEQKRKCSWSKPTEAKCGNWDSHMKALSDRLVGHRMGAGLFRKSLTNFFKDSELMGLYRFLGHLHEDVMRDKDGRRKHRVLTQIERENYEVRTDKDKVQKDFRLFRNIQECLELSDERIEHIRKLSSELQVLIHGVKRERVRSA